MHFYIVCLVCFHGRSIIAANLFYPPQNFLTITFTGQMMPFSASSVYCQTKLCKKQYFGLNERAMKNINLIP